MTTIKLLWDTGQESEQEVSSRDLGGCETINIPVRGEHELREIVFQRLEILDCDSLQRAVWVQSGTSDKVLKDYLIRRSEDLARHAYGRLR